MLATLVDEPPPDEESWVKERKYDGYRALCGISNGRVAMVTRNGLDLVGRFPAIGRSVSQIVVGDAVVDGEIAILDGKGVPRFELIQQGKNDEALLFAFDLLRLDGEDLRPRPIEQRRDLLRSLLSNAPANLRVSEELQGKVGDLLARIPGVQEVHHIAGEDCFLVKVRTADAKSLGRLLREDIAATGPVRTRTTVVLETLYETARLPLTDLPAAVSISTSRPGLPRPGGAAFIRYPAMLYNPTSP